MSAPEVDSHNKVRPAQGTLRSQGGVEMGPAGGTAKAKIWLMKGLAAVRPWRIGRVLVLSGLLAAGAWFYFDMASAGETGDRPPVNSSAVVSDITGKEWVVWSEEERASRYDLAIKSLEDQISGMLEEAARDSVRTGARVNREIERMDYEIGILEAEVTVASSSGSQSRLQPQNERLEGKISSLLREAQEGPGATMSRLSREVEGLDYQIDVLRRASKPQP